MKKTATLALIALAALSQPVLAQTAMAQSAFVMIIGEFPERAPKTTTTVLSDEQIIELAAENACEKPFIRDLKANSLYAECLTQARALATTRLSQERAASMQLASR